MLEQFIKITENLNLSTEERAIVLKEIKAIKKTIEVAEFKYNRTVIDKLAITNILNASIGEVEKQKKIIEESKDEINRTLQEMDKQKTLIEVKNKELNKLLTDLKEAQQQLIMSEKMASLGQLTAGVAHEINNPINFVSANIKPLKEDLTELIECINKYDQIIKENDLKPLFQSVQQFKNDTDLSYTLQEIQDLLRGIEEGASRTTEIVKGLRNFSRLDQNVVKETDLNEGIESTLTLLHSMYKDKVEVIKDYGNIPQVTCLASQINQVFMNILSNAIQAIEEKGKVFIKTWQDDKLVKIKITDTGNGMNEITKQKIFDPFFTTKEVGKGTGLGLSISYGIIKKHEGQIEVSSEIGKGTSFIISLPIKATLNKFIKST